MESAIFPVKPLFHPLADKVLLVDAPQELRLERACKRDSAPRERILDRMKQQSFSADDADAVIINDSDADTLRLKVDEALLRMNLI